MLNRILFAAGFAEGAHFTTAAGSGSSSDTGYDVCVDTADGSYYMVGSYTDTNSCGFIVKLDASGNELWKRKLSVGGANVVVNGCGLDSSGNLYVIGNRTSASGYLSLLKYNSSGSLQWQRKLTWASSVSSRGFDVDASGNCVVGAEVNAATAYGVVAVYNSSGTLQWQRKTSQANYCAAAQGCAFDASGNVYTHGTFYNGGASSSLAEWLTQKYNSAGTRQWQKSFKIGASEGSRLAVDSTGAVFLSGFTTVSAASRHTIIKISSSGTEQWHKYFTTSGNPGSSYACRADASDHLWVAVGTLGTLVKLDGATGAILLQRSFAGDSGTPSVGGVRVNGSTLLVATSIAKTGAGNDAAAMRAPSSGAGTGSYDFIDYAAGSLAVSTSTVTAGTPTTTDAAGDGTDAAGTLTDAAGNVTVTRIS